MKKITVILTALVAFVAVASAQKTESIINDVLKQSVENKVAYLQELIKFDDSQASQLKTAEFNYLSEVRKAENCCLCNKKKRIEKLQKNRDAELQKILTREQYIKYDAVENERIKKIPVWL